MNIPEFASTFKSTPPSKLGDEASEYQKSSVNGRRGTLTSESTTVQPSTNHSHDERKLETERGLNSKSRSKKPQSLSHKNLFMHNGQTRKLESLKA